MEIRKTEAIKLIIRVTTQELFESVCKMTGSLEPTVRNSIIFSLVTGYEHNIRSLFREGLLFTLYADKLVDQLKDVDLIEVHVTTDKNETIIIPQSGIYGTAEHQQIHRAHRPTEPPRNVSRRNNRSAQSKRSA